MSEEKTILSEETQFKQFVAEQVVKKFQEYVATYSDQLFYKTYSVECIVNDMIYGLGIAIDDKFKFANGYREWKKELNEIINKEIEKPKPTKPSSGGQSLYSYSKSFEIPKEFGCPIVNENIDKTIDEYFAKKLIKTKKLYKHPSIIDSIIDAYKLKKERNWDTLYFAFDLHGTIIEPGRLKDLTIYPNVERVLRFLSEQENIVLILFTSTTHEALKPFSEWCFKNKIYFKYFNENPECLNNHEGDYTSKFYYNILFDDRAGFDPMHWSLVEEQLKIEIKNEQI
jgi:hypothetical protein